LLAQGPPGRGDPWSRLKRFDADGDGRVSREEFGGPARVFERFDRDRDGFVTEQEVRAMRGRGGMGRREGGTGRIAERMDPDGDGRISKAEWDAFFEKADRNGDGLVDRAEFRAAASGRAYEDRAPARGSPAPAVKLKRLDGRGTVDLSRPRRPTVLIFGSYT
ncbi:MAG: EF-hand domain-containing protein, partial [Planctomycetota bacterium]